MVAKELFVCSAHRGVAVLGSVLVLLLTGHPSAHAEQVEIVTGSPSPVACLP